MGSAPKGPPAPKTSIQGGIPTAPKQHVINLKERVGISDTSTISSGGVTYTGGTRPPSGEQIEAEKQAERAGITTGGQFTSLQGEEPKGLSQQQFEQLSPHLREKYSKDVEKLEREYYESERQKEKAKTEQEEAAERITSRYDDPEFAAEYEQGKLLTPEGIPLTISYEEPSDEEQKLQRQSAFESDISKQISEFGETKNLKAITLTLPSGEQKTYEPEKALAGIVTELRASGLPEKDFEISIGAVTQQSVRVSETGQPLTAEEKKARGKAFMEGQKQLVGLVKSAKERGVPEITLFKAGTQEAVASIPVSDVGRTRYDILKKQIEFGKQGLDVEIGYQYTTIETTTISGPRNVIGTYADLADLGILKKPTTLQEQAKYYAGVAIRPIGEYVPSTLNLAELAKGKPPKYEYEPSIVSKGLGGASESLAYTITGGWSGKTPQESFKPFVEEITQRPASVAIQAPAIAVDFFVGGTVIKGGLKVASQVSDVIRLGQVKKVGKIYFGESPFGIEKTNKNLYRITGTTEEQRTTKISEKLEPEIEVIRQQRVEKIPGYGPVSKPTGKVTAVKPIEPKVTIPEPIKEKPITDVFVQFGKKAKEAKVIEVVESKPIIPKQIIIEGEVAPATAKLVGVKKVGEVFVGRKPTSKGLEEIAKAEEFGKIAQVAETRQAPLKAVLKGKADVLRGYAVGKQQYRTRVYQVERPLGTPIGATEAARVSPKSFIKAIIKGRKYEGISLLEKSRQFVGAKGYGRILKGVGIVEGKGKRKIGKTKPYEPPTESRVGAGQSGKALKYGEKTTGVLTKVLGQPVITKPRYDYLGPVLSPTEKQLIRERKVIEEEESQELQYPPQQKTRLAEQLTTSQSIRTQEELRTKEQVKPITVNILSQRPKIKEETKEIIIPRLVTIPTVRTEQQPRLQTGFKLIQTPFLEQKLVQREETVTERIKTPLFKRPPIPPPGPSIPIYYEIKKKERKERSRDRIEFIGNVPLREFAGVYKRKEITYGSKAVARLVGRDISLSRGTKPRRKKYEGRGKKASLFGRSRSIRI